MNRDKAIVILNIIKRNFVIDIEVPLNIAANELVIALNSSYDLGIDVANVKECYLKTENPIALVRVIGYFQNLEFIMVLLLTLQTEENVYG